MKNNYQTTPLQLIKKIIFSIWFSLIGYACCSQVSFGVKSGINIATTKDLIAYPKNRVGWYAGAFSKIPIHKKLFLQPEFLYSTKGHKSYNQIGDSKLITRFNYLNVPILLGYKIDHKTSLFFGPELGYLTSAHLLVSDIENLNVSKNYPPKFDVGLAVGLNYKIIKNIGAEVRYNYGFNTLYSIDAVGNRYSENKGGNRVFTIGVNYVFFNNPNF
ncbi:MAG: porin family protein [Chitinophagaceae bacterium]